MRPVDPKVPKPLKTRNPLGGPSPGGPDAFASRLEEAEKALERARGLHEAYFLGMEKRAPEPERLDLQRRLNELRRQGTSNTGLRFRLENLVQRHIVLATYWSRTLREIENGTYRRDIFKANRHQAERAAARAASTSVAPKAPADPPPPTTAVPAAPDLPPPPVPTARPVSAPPPASPIQGPPPGPPARAVPPPIPPAALKRAAAAAIMSRPPPTTAAATPPAATAPPPSSPKR